MNGDSSGDLLAYNKTTGAWMAFLSSGGSLVAGPAGTWSPGWLIQPARFKFNTGGLTDLFFYNPSNGQWRKGLNNGAGWDIYNAGYAWPTGYSPIVLDLNGDGISDVFAINSTTGEHRTCVGHTGLTDFSYITGNNWVPGFKVFPARFNNDATDDILAYNEGYGIFMRLAMTGQSIYSAYAGDVQWGPHWQVYPGDFNGTGLSAVTLYRTGDGASFRVTFPTIASSSYIVSAWPQSLSLIQKGDFNGDGKTDLFLFSTTGGWYLLLANASGGFTVVTTGTAASGWTPTVLKLDSDSYSDVLWYQASTGATIILHGTGAGKFSAAVTGPNIGAGMTIISGSPVVK